MARRRSLESEEPSGAAAGLDRSAVTGALRNAVSPFGQLMGMAPTRATRVMKPPIALAVRSGFTIIAGQVTGPYLLSCPVPALLSATSTNRTTGEDQLDQSLPEAEPKSQDQPVPFRRPCLQSSRNFRIV